MRTNKIIVGLAVSVLTCFSSTGFAQGAPTAKGLYFNVDAGACFVQDTTLEGFPEGVAPGSEVTFDTGFRAGFAGGYLFNPYMAVEGQVGFMEGYLDSVTGATELDAFMSQVPFMVDLRLQLPNKTIITPYAGAGVGGSSVFLNIEEWRQNNISLDGAGADTVFAWQAFAGFRVALNATMQLGVEYRYVASQGPSWETDGIDTSDSEIEFGDLETHNVSLIFQWRF
jgi:outer membrane protein